MIQSNPNEQNVELNRTGLYWGVITHFCTCYFIFELLFQLREERRIIK